MAECLTCPICMEPIEDVAKNCVTTTCEHRFHSSCLMQNIVRNGLRWKF